MRAFLVTAITGALLAAGNAFAGPVFEPLAAFASQDSSPRAGLVQASDGNFYGTTYSGGIGYGTVFRISPAGVRTKLLDFNSTNGASPYGQLVQAADGNLYGTTYQGGTSGQGTVFRITTAGVLTKLVDFNNTNGSYPYAGLVQAADGNLYGTTYQGGTSGQGTVFRITTAGVLTKLLDFNSTNGAYPYAGLVQASDGNLYGTTLQGGTSGYGTVFRMTTAGAHTKLVDFNNTNGRTPYAGLVQASDGNLYGTTYQGGTSGYGTVFRVTTAGILTKLLDFNNTNGRYPYAGLVQATNGNLYGTTQQGGTGGQGTVFQITTAGTLTKLLDFNNTNGGYPLAALVQATDGNLYGTTSQGGTGNYGTVFRITTAGAHTVVSEFVQTSGRTPYAGLFQATDGNFYGTTYTGGASGYGTVFRVTPAGVVTKLLDFNNTNGSNPYAGLVQASDGNLYGTTFAGGTSGYGTVFKITTAGVHTKLLDFNYSNGGHPYAGLVQASDGNIYGTTYYGGTSGYGTVFRITTAGVHTKLLDFTGTNGRYPYASVVQASDGHLYGTTYYGGTSDYGTVFRITTAGVHTKLLDFNNTNGRNPYAGLLQASNGNLYGTTLNGGTSDYGTVFQITTAGAHTKLLDFNNTNGRNPYAGLVQASDGNLYGTTYGGGTSSQGIVYKITTAGAYTKLLDFNGTNGRNPYAGLMQATDGNLYGTTSSGGSTPDGLPGGSGQIYRLLFGPNVETLAASNWTSSGVTLHGSADPLGNATTVSFEYGTDSSLTTVTTVSAGSIGSGTGDVPFSAPISGLDPNTVYYYRAVASNAENPTPARGEIRSFSTAAPVTFANSPRNWAVLGGEYEFLPDFAHVVSPPVTLSVLQKPSWLSLTGSRLAGTPPNEDEGLNPLVLLRATNGDGSFVNLSFNIRIGRLVGPVDAPPGGGSKTWVEGMPELARTGGDALLVTGVTRASEFPIFWGLRPDGVAMAMDYSGPSGAGGTDFEVPGGFTFDAAEILQRITASPADAAAGTGVWMGTTNRPASNGGAQVNTYLRADARDIADTASVPFTPGTVAGVVASVGDLARIPASGDLRVNLYLNANAAHPAGTAALTWFNALSPKLSTDRTITSFSSAYYWVNTVPRLTANNGMAVNQGGTVTLTTTMLNATDTEDSAADLRFVLDNGTGGGAPLKGVVEVESASVWSPLAAGGSFTLAQVQAGKVRYVHGGDYQTWDGFQFRLLDAQNTVARDGEYTVFTAPINVTLVNHPPVANDQSASVGLGATYNGTLDFSDPDIGFMPQTIEVSSTDSPTLGTFTITNPATGAFTFVSNGTPGTEVIEWTVSDGEFTATAEWTATIENQTPVVQSIHLSGNNQGNLTGTLTVVDSDLPAQVITLQLVSPPAKGTVNMNGLDLTYTPAPGRFGNDQFTVTATDSLGAISAAQTVTVSLRPGAFGPEALFLGGKLPATGGGDQGVIQRYNPQNGDTYTLATNLGREVRGLAWSPELGKLVVALAVSESGSPQNGLLKVDPLTGDWGMGDIITVDGNLAFPLMVSNDGPEHVLVANGPGGVVRVNLLTGAQQLLDLGLPAGEFVAGAVAVGPEEIWVTSIKDFGTPGDGNLFLTNRATHTSSTPVGFSPAGDPAGIFLTGDGNLAIARSGFPVEEIGLSPIAYAPHAGSPTAPWALGTGLTSYGNLWVVANPFAEGAASLSTQQKDTTVVNGVVPQAGEETLASVTALLSAAGVPQLAVEVSGGGGIEAGDTTDFGTAAPSGGQVVVEFSITNNGTDVLTLGTPALGGAHPADFVWVDDPAGNLPVGQSVSFAIRFDPEASGVSSATISIPSNDPEFSSGFTWNLTGLGNTPPTFAGPYPVSTAYQTAASISLGKLLAKASDTDGDALTVTAAGPASGEGGTAVLQAGSILYTPPNSFSGSDSFTIVITDALGATVNGTVTITVGANPNSGGQGNNTPQLTMLPGGDMGIAFQGIPGRSYEVQRSTNLTSWITIATVTAATNGAVTFTDENPPQPNGYYRLRKP